MGGLCCDCGVMLCRYGVLNIGEFVYCDCRVLLCVGMGYRLRGFV